MAAAGNDSAPPEASALPLRTRVHGLYAVTPDEADTAMLADRVRAVVAGGARFVQYRNKAAPPALRREQAAALLAICHGAGAALIINDHLELALEIGADGVHLGRGDGAVAQARATLGSDKILGVSCYDTVRYALESQKQGADYVAFGSFFLSNVKPGAVRAPLELLAQAKLLLSIPVVAIGGITLDNAAELIAAGADSVAVISALFGAPDIKAAAQHFCNLFRLMP
ncbi:MAG: thiamine phosphate synthase [Betaproteobacteria bacterium]|nr:thiamine phosphate synthase [Betaproteobacteria bacterium]